MSFLFTNLTELDLLPIKFQIDIEEKWTKTMINIAGNPAMNELGKGERR